MGTVENVSSVSARTKVPREISKEIKDLTDNLRGKFAKTKSLSGVITGAWISYVHIFVPGHSQALMDKVVAKLKKEGAIETPKQGQMELNGVKILVTFDQSMHLIKPIKRG